MRRAVATLSVLLLLTPEIPAQTTEQWEKVQRVHPGEKVAVSLDNRESVKGTLESASDEDLQINTRDRKNHGVVSTRTISRPAVVKVVWIQPGYGSSCRALAVGAIAGGAFGVALVAREDTRHASKDRLLMGVFGALVGVGAAFRFATTANETSGSRCAARPTLIYKRPRKRRGGPLPPVVANPAVASP